MENIVLSKKEPDQVEKITVEDTGSTVEDTGSTVEDTGSNDKTNILNLSSEGEKSLLRKNPAWLINPKVKNKILETSLSSLDETIATPLFNVNVIKSACNKDYSFFDKINKSKYAAYVDASLTILGLFTVLIGIYGVEYCKLREEERKSNFFYFTRLLKTKNATVIEEKMGNINQEDFNFDRYINYEHLFAAAYFYSPDISKIACWRRRVFSSGKKRKHLKDLKLLFENYSKEEVLGKLHKKILEKTCLYLNKKSKFKKFELKKSVKKEWIIDLTDRYAEKIFYRFQNDIKKNSIIDEKNKDKIKINFFSIFFSSIGQSSFIYWILTFIFYFIPIAPVITTACISIIPALVVLIGVFPLLFFLNTYKTYKTFKSEKEMTLENIEEENKAQLREKMVLLNKEKIFLNGLKIKEIDLVPLKNSPLMADLKDVLENHSFSKIFTLSISFIEGCFFPFFAGWLFVDGIKIILTYLLCPAGMALTSFTPIGSVATAIIIGVSLLIGIIYGIYSIYKAKQDYELKFNNIRNKVKVLCDEVPNRKVLNKSLCDYDRLLRRFADERPLWTTVKKILNRFMVCFKRSGTGSLFFRLILWTSITTIITAFAPINLGFPPIILIMGIAFSAVIFMAGSFCTYNFESKMRQAGRLVEHLTQTERLNCVDVGLAEEGFGLAVLGLEHRGNSFHAEMDKVQNKSDTEKINNRSTLRRGLFVTTKHQSSGRDEQTGTSHQAIVNAHY